MPLLPWALGYFQMLSFRTEKGFLVLNQQWHPTRALCAPLLQKGGWFSLSEHGDPEVQQNHLNTGWNLAYQAYPDLWDQHL